MKKIKVIVGVIAALGIVVLNFNYAENGYGAKNAIRTAKATEAMTETNPSGDWYDYILFLFYTQIEKQIKMVDCPPAKITSSVTTTVGGDVSGNTSTETTAEATDGVNSVNTSVSGELSAGLTAGTTTTTTAEYDLGTRQVESISCNKNLLSNDDCTETKGDPCNPAVR